MRVLLAAVFLVGCATSPIEQDEPESTSLQEAPVEAPEPTAPEPSAKTELGTCICDYVWSRDPATPDEPGFLCHPRGECPAGVVCVPGEMGPGDTEPVCVMK